MTTPLASMQQLSRRIGETLVGPEADRAQAALEDASALVRQAARRDWDPGSVPDIIQSLTLTVARRAYRNPDAVSQTSVGDVSVSYSSGGGAIYLTKEERRLVRRAASAQGIRVIDLTASET